MSFRQMQVVEVYRIKVLIFFFFTFTYAYKGIMTQLLFIFTLLKLRNGGDISR